ncbi:MAG: TonB-dependent receptor [Chitinophagales bacterium]|nr:TonB-dependent receptor [Chitinophagales bacterium]
MKKLFTFFFLLISLFSSAQTGTLKGVVLDAATKETIMGANVFHSQKKSNGTVSDYEGNYSLELTATEHALICAYLGFVSDTFRVIIEAGKISTYNVLLLRDAKELSTIVVSAGKYEQKIEEVTVSIEILPLHLIENKNTTNITQALEQVPGLNILDEEPQIRGGSGFAFGVGSRVATLIDGIPILRGDIGKPDWSFIPVENIDQVEVIKGASSVLYGSSALSGVINFLSAYPKQPSETKVRLYSGIYSPPTNPDARWWSGAANYSGLNISQGWKTERIDLILGGQLLYDHGYIGPPIPNPNLSFEQDSLSNSDVADKSGRFNFDFRYRPKNIEGMSMGLNGNMMRQQSNFSLVWGNDSSQIYRAFPGTMTLTNNLQFYLDPFITYFTKAGIHHTLRSRIYVDKSELPEEQNTSSNVWYLEYQLSKDFSKIEGLHFTSGLVSNRSVTHNDLYATATSRENTLNNYAAYLQFDKKFKDVVNLSIGFRGEYFKINNTQSTVKPIFRAGVNFKLTQSAHLRISYGQGFRYPTIAEKFLQTTVGGLIVYPNPTLLPEISWNAEMGVKQSIKIGKWFCFLDGAAFWQEYKNTIEYNYALFSPDSAGFKFLNTGPARVRGLDFSISGTGKIFNAVTLTVIGGYTYTLPQSVDPHLVYATEKPGEGFIPKQLSYISTSSDTTDYILKYRLQHIAKIDAELGWKKITAGFSIRYYSFMNNIDKTFYDIDNTGTLPTGIVDYRATHSTGSIVTDIRIGYDITKKYKASLVVNNLFNLAYSLRPVKVEPMRTIAIQLRADI